MDRTRKAGPEARRQMITVGDEFYSSTWGLQNREGVSHSNTYHVHQWLIHAFRNKCIWSFLTGNTASDTLKQVLDARVFWAIILALTAVPPSHFSGSFGVHVPNLSSSTFL